jgi:hypothetical protein
MSRVSVRYLFGGNDRLHKRFLSFLDRGFCGVVLLLGGRWVAYSWFRRPGAPPPPHLPRGFKDIDADWIFHSHTREGFRGCGYFTKLLVHIVQLTRKEGSSYPTYVDALTTNIASRRAILSAGFSPCGLITVDYLWVPRVRRMALRGSWNRERAHPALPAARKRSPHLDGQAFHSYSQIFSKSPSRTLRDV